MGRFLSVVLLALFLTQPCFGEVTGVTSNPSSPLMGEIVAYSLIDDGMDDIVSVKWEYKFTSGSCVGLWIEDNTQTGPTATWRESRPGTWAMRITITYGINSGGQMHPPTVINTSVTIAPATKFTFAGGFNTPANLGDPIFALYQVEGADRPCGPYLVGCVIQEKLTNKELPNPPFTTNPADDANFQPEQAADEFHLEENIVHDEKTFNPEGPWYEQLAVGGTAYECDQALRLKYIDPCGVTQYIDLGTFHFRRVKVSNSQWKLATP